MLGSIYIGLSGMNAYSEGLKQISNNITNINTNGFKGSSVSFSNLNSESSDPEVQSGQGVRLDEAELDASQGELRQTTRDLDLSIDGNGYLVVLKDGERRYLRTGSFEIGQDGYVVLSGTKNRLTLLDGNGQPAAVNVNSYSTYAPQATTRVRFSDNLTSGPTTFTISDIKVYDAEGQLETWNVTFTRAETDPVGQYRVDVRVGTAAAFHTGTLKFINGVVDPATSSFAVTKGARSATFDFTTNVSSFSSGTVSTLRVSESDGYAFGDLKTVIANENGELEVQYTNDQKRSLGAITLASFRDPHDVEQGSDGLFLHKGGSSVDFLTSVHETVGKVMSRRLEASNVDLSKEFGDLILVQRGYQASSQIVSVSNDMIQQLFGIRGQG